MAPVEKSLSMPKDRTPLRSHFSNSDVIAPGGARAPIAKLLAALGEGAGTCDEHGNNMNCL